MMVIKPANAWIPIIKMVNNAIFASPVVWLVITVIIVTLVIQMLTLLRMKIMYACAKMIIISLKIDHVFHVLS